MPKTVSLKARQDFWDNVNYNKHMAKYRAKPRHKNILRVVKMRAEEVLKRISELGVNTTEGTLQRYAKIGLIEKPLTKSLGRGRGKISDWPDDTAEQFIASWWLRNSLKIKPDDIRAGKEFKRRILRENPDGYPESEEEIRLFDIGLEWDKYYKAVKRWSGTKD